MTYPKLVCDPQIVTAAEYYTKLNVDILKENACHEQGDECSTTMPNVAYCPSMSASVEPPTPPAPPGPVAAHSYCIKRGSNEVSFSVGFPSFPLMAGLILRDAGLPRSASSIARSPRGLGTEVFLRE